MPFDTTYYISSYDPARNASMVLKGGKDTFIFLKEWQLPSELNSSLAADDSVVRSFQYSLVKPLEPTKPYDPGAGLIFIFIAVFGFILYKIWRESRTGTYSKTIFYNNEDPRSKAYLTYYGDELNISNEQIISILTKHFPYFNALSEDNKKIFLERIQKFIADKTFKIHDDKGFKEMPVLVSAAAIQLTFGLKKYLLPHFEFIHIHPQEFLRVKPIICFLEGNVSGHSINLSWKHFLEGYANPTDGQNVGLHELAHALHYQTFVVERNIDRSFRNSFDNFTVDGNKAFNTEKTVAGGLYSEYAEKNFQEFWAESVEIFFEKPAEMQAFYPDLYESMKRLLKQDPANNIPSIES